MTVLAFLAAASSGCSTGDSLTRISTTPAGATVQIDGYGSCVTPCTVEILSPVKASVAKAGFRKEDLELTPRGRDLDITLELAAPTGDVEEQTLPEL